MSITLLPADPGLAELWYEWREDEELQRFNPAEAMSVNQLRERLSRAGSDLLSAFNAHDSFSWFIGVEKDLPGQPVGMISLNQINRTMLTAEIGYTIARNFRAQGIATAAVRQVAEKCFSQTPLRKLIAFVHEDNLPSRMVLENAGFRLEGLLREHFLIRGQPVNEVLYGILRGEIKKTS